MSLYAIGDTHLSLGVDKPMDIFGGGWAGYVEKLREGFSQIGPEDTVVLCGDLSWGMSLEQAREDFAFLDSLPGGRKILLKGNHDYWWTTRGQDGKILCRKRVFHPGDPAQQLPAVRRSGSCAGPGAGSMRRSGANTARKFSTGSFYA